MATILAGFPKNLGATRNYENAFAQMASVGITGFFPVDTTQTVATYEALGWAEDFAPPKVFELSNAGIAAIKANGIKLILNGPQFYPRGAPYPSLANDPLKKFIAAHGSDVLLGMWGYDEPASTGVLVSDSQKLRDRRNAVLPSLPIYMCHAPMVNSASYDTAAKRTAYLNLCIQHQAYADVAMVDVYPFPVSLANIMLPNGTVATTWQAAITGYHNWIASSFPTKRKGFVLQAFTMSDQYSDAALAGLGLTRAQAQTNYPGPTMAEMIAAKALCGGDDAIGWYGPSFQPTDQSPYWTQLAGVA